MPIKLSCSSIVTINVIENQGHFLINKIFDLMNKSNNINYHNITNNINKHFCL